MEGLVKKPQVYAFDDLVKGMTIEDRVYRMRCVEGWSMVIPWQGFQLSELIKRLEPSSQARYIEFQTLYALTNCRSSAGRFCNGRMSKVCDWMKR